MVGVPVVVDVELLVCVPVTVCVEVMKPVPERLGV